MINKRNKKGQTGIKVKGLKQKKRSIAGPKEQFKWPEQKKDQESEQ